jgi:hypothetical protein
MAFNRNAMLHECRREGARVFKGDVSEVNGAQGHLRAIELRFGCDGAERHLIFVRTSGWGILWEEK